VWPGVEARQSLEVTCRLHATGSFGKPPAVALKASKTPVWVDNGGTGFVGKNAILKKN
jgi:hypothetical protein